MRAEFFHDHDRTWPTIAAARAYARGSRVELLRSAAGEVRAEVLGTQTYHVHLGVSSWSCDCPVGVSGAVCKHVVAVIVCETDDDAAPPTQDDPRGAEPVESWLGRPDADALRDLLRDVAGQVPGSVSYIIIGDAFASLIRARRRRLLPSPCSPKPERSHAAHATSHAPATLHRSASECSNRPPPTPESRSEQRLRASPGTAMHLWRREFESPILTSRRRLGARSPNARSGRVGPDPVVAGRGRPNGETSEGPPGHGS
jgi:hypothetical protein